MAKHVPINAALADYLLRCASPPDPALRGLADRTEELGDVGGMMIPVEQAALLTLLTKLLDARLAVDLGTFTGMSALAIARGLAAGGKVVTCDVTDRWLDLAGEYWERAGVADRIEFRLGPAGRILESLPSNVDLMFVDADKMNYRGYYRAAVPLLRPGGLLVLDNVLLEGYVLDPALAGDRLARRCATVLRAVNAELAADDRLEAVLLPIADGVTIARKR
jgi:caffeoyl-CoA O-methyltransferase